MRGVRTIAADSKYPLSQKLVEIFAKDYSRRAPDQSRGRRSEKFTSDHRNDVISESLCDDTIAYLAPTLEQHKGCTIIDVHPGACVWSSKLHDFLKPKRHLLMEPEKDYYEPFIKPLLEKPGSTYRHTLLPGAHPSGYWANYAKVFKDPELVPRTALPVNDPALRQLDPSVLVIANLTRQYKFSKRTASVQFASLITQQWLYAALSNEIFHTAGLVRSLLWVPEGDKYTMFPTTEVFRRSLSTKLTFGASLTEAVGTLNLHKSENTFYARRRPRPAVIEALFAERAQLRMKDSAMRPPKSREFLYERPKVDTNQFKSPLETKVRSLEDLTSEIDAVEERFKTVISQMPQQGSLHSLSPAESRLMASLEYPQVAASADIHSTVNIRPAKIAPLADLGLRILKLEVGYKVLEEKQGVSAKLRSVGDRVLQMDSDFSSAVHERSAVLGNTVTLVIDQTHACSLDTPLLALDARDYEALKAEPSDFWPNNQLMLLDMVPKTRDLSVPDLMSRREGAKLCETLLKSLMQSTTMGLPDGLERLAPNASKDLPPMVPAMTDPRKGGRLNPNKVRLRMISEDIIEGLIKAWVEWPFKPSLVDLELAADGRSGAEGEDIETPAAE